jgi:hypothetical protein
MMKPRTRSLLTALTMAMSLALLALGAFGSTSAGAQPVISPAPTSHEPVSFLGASGPVTFSDGVQTIKCSSAQISGEFTNSQEVKAGLSFTKCEALSGSHLEFTELLKGRLGFVSKILEEGGLLLEPASGEVFAKEFYDGTYAAGGLIGEVTPVEKSTKTLTLTYKAKELKQIPTEFEGEATEHFLTTPVYATKWATNASFTLSAFQQAGKEVTVRIHMYAPNAVTGAASSIEPTKATLNGSVTPEYSETKYYFEYGTTTAYGKKTAEASLAAHLSPEEVSQALTGLSEATTYHYRLVATNKEGTVDGQDKTFTTTP